jgi:glycogen synthase
MRNGLVPVAEYCHGLPDFVRDFDPVTHAGNGLVFYQHALPVLVDALKRALFLPASDLEILSQRGRDRDFSWGPAVVRLEHLHRRLLREFGRSAD